MAKLEDETIHMNVLAASSLVMEAIIEYKKEHGEIHFQLQQNTESGLYDIAVTTKMFYLGIDEKNSFSCAEKIYLAVPDDNKYKGRTSIRLEEVKDEGFIRAGLSKGYRNYLQYE